MQVRCPGCHQTFEAVRYGRQSCPRCGAELDLQRPGTADDAGERASPSLPPGHEEAGAPGGWPPAGSNAPPTAPLRPSPWERRAELGFFPALFQTWVEATFRPTAFFSSLAPAGIGPALGYAMLVGSVGSIFGTLWIDLAELASDGPRVGGSGVGLAASLILVPFLVAIGLFVGSAILHVGCMVFGCATRGYEATFRSVAYSTGPAIFGLAPLCGILVAGIWTFFLELIALQHLQQTTSGKALGALVFPTLVAIACACGMGLLLAGSAALLGMQLS